MLEMSQLLSVFKHLFKDRGYGENLQDFIASRNPKTPADIEHLERQWLYNIRHGGQWQ